MLVLATVIVWVAAGALFWAALTGLELRFAIASRKHAQVSVDSVAIDPRPKTR